VDLASYRELESFSQFGSDLDAATQAKLNRGRRTVEVLKQPVHKPLPVEKQVLILYALRQGFLDSVPVSDILRYESEVADYFDAKYSDLLKQIATTGQLPDGDKFDNALKEFAKVFKTSATATANK
jgi:F-type H+-transporting ATPase subunit alpha